MVIKLLFVLLLLINLSCQAGNGAQIKGLKNTVSADTSATPKSLVSSELEPLNKIPVSKWDKGPIRTMSLTSYSLFANRNIY